MSKLLPLKGCKICVTGVTSKEENIAAKIIKEMGGTFSTNLSKDIYCLLVKRVGSKKHITAQNLGIPSLEMEWLFCCKTEFKKLDFDIYKVRPFLGCMITCTQVTPEIRFKLQKLIEENGGKYNPVLDKDSCTHLVAVNKEGEKYLHAKSWGTVHIVTLSWIEECTLQKSKLI
jgi:topoisomerase (DNA) II binding protein 1